MIQRRPSSKMAVTVLAGLSILLWLDEAAAQMKDSVKSEDCRVQLERRIVRGASMLPLLRPGQTVRILRGYYRCHDVRRGDLAMLQKSPLDPDPILKTVMGVPGDKFELRPAPGGGWRLLINGKPARNSSRVPYRLDARAHRLLSLYVTSYRGVVPRSAFLVLGDRPEGSADSTLFGLLPAASFLGKVVVKSGTRKNI